MRPSTPKLPYSLSHRSTALALLITASLAFGIARALAVPPGYNVDEWARMPFILRQAACWRETFNVLTFERSNVQTLVCWQARHFNGNPSYYLLLSIPEGFALDQSEATQYFIARLTTAGLGLATVWLAWLTCRELLGDHEGRPYIALGIAAAVALNQSFGDIMSGVNSDASTTAALAVLIFAMARCEARRFSLSQLAFLTAALSVCASTSRTALWLGLPLVTWWGLSRLGHRARLAILVAAMLIGLVALIMPGGPIEWTTPQYWFDAGSSEILGAATRVEAGGPVGPHAIAVQRTDNGRPNHDEVQFLPDAIAKGLAGKTITFGAWLLAPDGEIVQGPIWDDGGQQAARWVAGTGGWQFAAATVTVSPSAQTGAMFVSPPADGERVLFDGLVVAEGTFPTDSPPKFDDVRGLAGTWGGRRFTNLLLNPSVEATWPSLRTDWGPRDFIAYNGRLRSFLAWRRTASAYPAILSWLFAGFWSGFSGIYPGLSSSGLIPFAVLTAVAAAGCAVIGFAPETRDRKPMRHAVRFFAPLAIIIWLTVILRADLWPNLPEVFSFAGARYALTGIVPTMALIVVGSLHWVPQRARRAALAALALSLWFTSVYILVRVQVPFYHCLLQTPAVASCLTTLR